MRSIESAQFLDVFCIFEYQENKQFFRFLGTDSKALLFHDGAVRLLRKGNSRFFAILRKSCGSGINIVLDKSDRMLFLPILSLSIINGLKIRKVGIICHTEETEKCTKLLVETVARTVKFHLSQSKTSQSIATNVFKVIEEIKKIILV